MLRASIMTSGTSILMAAIALVNAAVTARGLGVEGRGLLATSILIVSVGRVVGLLGLGDALVRAIGQKRLEGRETRGLYWAMGVTALAGLCAGVVGVAVAPWGREAWGVLALTVVWTCLGSMVDLLVASARLNSNLSAFNVLRISSPLLATLATTVAFVTVDLSVTIVLAIQLVTSLLSLSWSLTMVKRLVHGGPWSRSEFSKSSGGHPKLSLRGLVRLGLSYHWLALLGLVLTHAHMAIVMTIATLGALGIYSAVYGLSRMVVPVQMAIGSAVFARSVRESYDSSASAALRAYRLTTAPMLLAALCGCMAAPWGVPLLLGSDFAQGVVPFGILLFEGVVGGASYILGQQLQGAGKVRSVLVRNLCSLVPVAIAPLVLAPEDVIVGMSFLLLGSACIRLVATLYAYRRTHDIYHLWPIPSRDDLRAVTTLMRGK